MGMGLRLAAFGRRSSAISGQIPVMLVEIGDRPSFPRGNSNKADFFLSLILQSFHNDIVIILTGATFANDSLFTYEEGKNHSSYFDVGYLPIFLDQDDLVFDNVSLGEQARDVCGDNKQCLFDVYTTGKVNIGLASMRAVESFLAVINDTETRGK